MVDRSASGGVSVSSFRSLWRDAVVVVVDSCSLLRPWLGSSVGRQLARETAVVPESEKAVAMISRAFARISPNMMLTPYML